MPPSNEELRLVRDVTTALIPAISGPRSSTPSHVSTPVRSEFHSEEAVAGVSLENFSKKVPSDDGTYVIVTEHKEWIEKIRQPPTPEEVAAEQEAVRKENRNAAIAVGTLITGVFGFLGWLMYQESKQFKERARTLQISKTTDEVDKS